jgi:UPF0716 family protein affecting phage T7 exclusion
MSKISWVIAAVLAADIASLIGAGAVAGFKFALGEVLVTALFGTILIASALLSRGSCDPEDWNPDEDHYAALMLSAGIMLLLPGPICDAVGLTLLGILLVARLSRRLKPSI